MKGGRPPAGQVELEADLPVNGGLIKRGGLLNKSGLITSGGNRKCPRCKAGDYDGVRCNACGFRHQPIPGTSSLAVDTLDFYRWCSFLAISVLRTRCSFAVFLRSTLHLPRSSVASESPAFPLPIPYCDVFARMPPGLSSIKRRRIAFRRALHVVVMALNFWWAGSSFISLELLGRVPSPSQRGILKRLSSMLLADGPLETFQALRSGRRFPELVARLTDLSCVLTKLGVGSGPYEKIYPGHDVPMDNTQFMELEPYKALDASRLRVVGSGSWDATDFLSPELCMAYRYPDSLLFARDLQQFEIPQRTDPATEVVKLAKLWDARGLLHIHDIDLQTEARHELVRVFNCLKNETCDRQIGDRRGRNAIERRLLGPSASLPTGPDLLDFWLDPRSSTLSIVCTDRRDFYHQFATSVNRTKSNTVGPMVFLRELEGTTALAEFYAAKRQRKPPRHLHGDQLGLSQRQHFTRCPPGYGMVAFQSIFQGDHAGVEIATSAHENLLKSVGLLTEQSRLVADRPFMGGDLCEGLVIDDYFAIASVPKSILVPSPSLECLATSKKADAEHGILGSDDKDVVGARKAKIIGACLNASPQCQDRGHVFASAPAEKRFSLAWVTLQLCQLSHTTDVLHLCLVGGWTSALMFRRPFMSILDRVFHLVDINAYNPSSPKLVKLPRPVVNELALLSVLAPLMVADLAVDFADKLFATDASLNKGAIVGCHVERKVAEILWRSCRSKGGYSKLLSPGQSVLSRCLDFEEAEPMKAESVRRPLAYRFDFVEVFAGAATVTKCVAALGYSVCCPIDISFDPELDVTKIHVIEWLIHLVSNRLVEAFMIEPPCTTFSIMRRPALRSRLQPFGFDLDDEQTCTGTVLAHRALQLLKVCARVGLTGILENPWTSKIKFLPAWFALLCDPCCELVRCDSCFYGSKHLKSFAFLCVWADTNPIAGRCTGDHQHVQIEGSLTKKSATYVDRSAEALASVFATGIERLRSFDNNIDEIKCEGLENQLINEVCLSSEWKTVSVWTFRVSSHINLLELSAVVRLAERLVKQGKSLRVTILVDSNVVCCAASKGRSSSRALAKLLSRLGALCIIGGLYLVFGFIPTRWNPADDPTRDCVLRSPIPGMDLAAWDRSLLFRLSRHPKLRRWASNWVRLVILLCGPAPLSFTDRSIFRAVPFPFGLSPQQSLHHGRCSDSSVSPSLELDHDVLVFDGTLGFPGEGPPSCFACHNLRSFRSFLFAVAMVLQGEAVLFPRNAGDRLRQTQRSARPPLQEGRPVLTITSQQRISFLTQFEKWLRVLGVSLDYLLENHVYSIDELNRHLVRYGRALYAVGRPYNHFAETINAIAARRPVVRRQLQEAWNFAFAWVREEPPVHHVAMPWQVLLACISTCLVWGWLDIAGMFALTWGALLRVGEFTGALRRDLLLPSDTCYTNNFALLSLKEPKTRFTAARHQCAKLDVPDLLRVVHIAFSRLRPGQKLWPRSGQTLRLRFKQVLTELGIQDVLLNNKRLDLGSLRPGGATWILQQTEDSEFTRRRGRWINQRVMEVYIQEISAFSFLAAIPDNVRQKVYGLSEIFPLVLQNAELFWNAAIPHDVWYLLWRSQVTRE